MKNVSAGIFIQDNTVLLAKRAKTGDVPGFWEFPGGKQEKDETIYACLEREIMEELHVRCKAKEVLAESIHVYDHGCFNLIGIIAELLDDTIKLTVHEDCQWVDIHTILQFNLAPADIPIAEKVIEYWVNQHKNRSVKPDAGRTL